MAKEIQAFRAYTPRIQHGKLVETKTVAELIEGRCSMTAGDVYSALLQLSYTFAFYATAGIPVRLMGVGIFSTTIDKGGVFGLNFRPDPALIAKINYKNKINFEGTIVNKDMMGKTAEEMVERWNKEHPDDPIERKPK